MRLASQVFILSVGVATISLIIGYGFSGLWPVTPIFLLLGLAWWYMRRRNRGGAIIFVFLLLAAVAGLLIRTGAAWSVVCLVAALTAWDLEGFLRLLKDASQEEMTSRIVTTHLRWLLAVDGIGLLLAITVPLIRMRFPLGVALLAILILFVALSRGIGYLRLKT